MVLMLPQIFKYALSVFSFEEVAVNILKSFPL
jgi:hypothetical protein